MKKIIDRVKSFFGIEEKNSETVTVQFQLPDGKRFDVEAVRILDYHKEFKCKIHWDYQGMIPPTNNCNECWEYYSKKIKS